MNLRGRIETQWTASKPGLPLSPGTSVEGTYLPITRCPVYRGRDPNPGFRTELENLAGDVKRKGASG